jgi:hypothetical protein
MGLALTIESSDKAVQYALTGRKTEIRQCCNADWSLEQIKMPDNSTRAAICGKPGQKYWMVGEKVGIKAYSNGPVVGKVRVVALRIEQLQDINDSGAYACAVEPPTREGYFAVWDTLNNQQGWKSTDNPKVVVINFAPVSP